MHHHTFFSAGSPVSDVLRQVYVPVSNQVTCNQKFGGLVDSTMICAGGAGIGVCHVSFSFSYKWKVTCFLDIN